MWSLPEVAKVSRFDVWISIACKRGNGSSSGRKGVNTEAPRIHLCGQALALSPQVLRPWLAAAKEERGPRIIAFRPPSCFNIHRFGQAFAKATGWGRKLAPKLQTWELSRTLVHSPNGVFHGAPMGARNSCIQVVCKHDGQRCRAICAYCSTQ